MKSLLLTFAFAATAGTALAADPPTPPVMAIGSQVPDFSLPAIDGKTYTLSSFKDAKVLCLIFTCNHCPDAIAAAGRMEEIHQAYKDKGVAVVSINSSSPLGLTPDELGYGAHGDTFEEMPLFAKDNNWTMPYLYDGETQTLSAACGAQSTPHVFIFGQDRKLAYTGRLDDAGRKSGPVEKSYIKNALDSILAGEPVKEPVTRSFGCSTKWKWKESWRKKDQENWEAKEVTLEKLDADLAKKLRENASGNVRLINFWSTTCGPCIAEFPDLVDAYRRFQNRSFDFISISLDPVEDQAKAQKFLAKQHAALSDKTKPSMEKEGRKSNNYIFSGDNADKLAEAIDKEWTGAQPHTVLISPKGEILWRHSAQLDPVELRRQIVKALEGMP
ncbi:redoxin domain-containing protein [Luteolibacter luteus]|uniref:Redoxin domain-containing protein n=1 Tax=Luteolibacter luteus TaxID=2728835 RepID=A0A858RPJ4_9BACT|nr:redoxin domain-containing protein [Luteolibacter luteus]QJE98782.1 redoxin domain-containing protein [Luteolibacter luteus]